MSETGSMVAGERTTARSPLGSRAVAALIVLVNVAIGMYALTRPYGYAELLLFYWAETVVIGALNVPKMLILALFGRRIDDLRGFREALERTAAVVLMLAFYVAIFAALAMVLFTAVIALPTVLEYADTAAGHSPPGTRAGSGFNLQLVVAALVVTHGLSLLVNFIGGREFRSGGLLRLAVQPFLRCALIVALIVSGGLAAWLVPGVATSTAFPVAIVAIKIWIDIYAHLAERRRFDPSRDGVQR
ncbi:MAG TPA: DUF6498-containing protein [Steroidobacteraceae bacterium]|nr:DUF6498-containing protein [Steroidobacteraceae bacterium]